MRDYAVESSSGALTVHRADCPHVRRLAELGEPVMTLLDCEQPPSLKWPRHACLADDVLHSSDQINGPGAPRNTPDP